MKILQAHLSLKLQNLPYQLKYPTVNSMKLIQNIFKRNFANSLRILRGKNHPKIKLQRLRKI